MDFLLNGDGSELQALTWLATMPFASATRCWSAAICRGSRQQSRLMQALNEQDVRSQILDRTARKFGGRNFLSFVLLADFILLLSVQTT
jgi:hypothetical protein